MAHLLKNLTNSIWHAFHALQADATNTVAKSKLKVREKEKERLVFYKLVKSPKVGKGSLENAKVTEISLTRIIRIIRHILHTLFYISLINNTVNTID